MDPVDKLRVFGYRPVTKPINVQNNPHAGNHGRDKQDDPILTFEPTDPELRGVSTTSIRIMRRMEAARRCRSGYVTGRISEWAHPTEP